MARNANSVEQHKTNSASGPLTPVEKQRMVRDIAQKLFEKRGRVPGYELEDWLEAERIVNGTS